MWRIILITICVLTWFGLTHVQTQAATAKSITIGQADRIHTYALRRNTTLNSVLQTSPTFIIFEHADKLFVPALRLAPSDLRTIYTNLQLHVFIQHADKLFVPVLRRAPSDLQTIYSALQSRVIIQHADKLYVPLLTQAPDALQSIYAALQSRIVIQHADAQFVPVLVPIILDNGIPTGTVARNGTVGTPTSTIHARRQVTVTPTTVPTDMPQSVTPMADKGTPSSTVVIESTPEPSATPTMIP